MLSIHFVLNKFCELHRNISRQIKRKKEVLEACTGITNTGSGAEPGTEIEFLVKSGSGSQEIIVDQQNSWVEYLLFYEAVEKHY